MHFEERRAAAELDRHEFLLLSRDASFSAAASQPHAGLRQPALHGRNVGAVVRLVGAAVLRQQRGLAEIVRLHRPLGRRARRRSLPLFFAISCRNTGR